MRKKGGNMSNVVENALKLQGQMGAVTSQVVAALVQGKAGSVELRVNNPEGTDWKVVVKSSKVRAPRTSGRTTKASTKRAKTTTKKRRTKRTTKK